ncbi:MAG: glycosyltransferase family 4 protein [Chloroflexi bacterium]|nr:MAG: glycosyltransferase family 4 protein [Chloroflexota bacterium]
MKPIRVLFLATRDWYHPATTGGDMTLWENARYLASVGHKVTFVTARYSGAPKQELLDGIEVVRLGGIHSLWFRTFLHYMRRCRGRYDVVVAEGFGGSRIPRLAPLYVKEPIITEWHQIHRDLFAIQYPRLLNGPLNLLERVAAWVHRDTLVRAGTVEWQAAFPTIGFHPDKVFLLPVSLRDDWLAESNGQRASDPTILWIGKLRRYKCPDHAIRAMVDVIASVPNAKLILAIRRDDIKYESELQSLVESLHLALHVEFRFNVSEEEKRRLLHSARVLVVTSAVEGFGIVVLEANACGLPVVASSRVPDGAARHEHNALKYQFGNVHELAGAIVRLLEDSTLYGRLSSIALNSVRDYSWSKVGAEFESVVARVASGRR